jgi:hypothetical protein
MFKLLSAIRSLLLLLLPMTLSGAINLYADRGHKPISRTAAGQNPNWQPVDLSGSYRGWVLFADRAGHPLIRGTVILKIEESGGRFSFTDGAGKELKGQISTLLIPENNLGVGWIQLDTDTEQIAIQWYKNNDRRDVLKLVRARGADRNFRFCSTTLTRVECRGNIRGERI